MRKPKFEPDVSDMLAVATKYFGNISQIAKHYGVARDTIYQYQTRNPEGKKIIDEVRGYNSHSDLDVAEFVNRYNMMNYKNNPALAQRAAEKVLDRKGHLRGWGDNGENKNNPNDDQIDIENSQMEELAKLRKRVAELESLHDI